MDDITLIQGDCLEIMDQIPDESIDMILTDPPYMINTKSGATLGKIDPWADYCNAAYWYAAWMKKSRLKLKNTGCLWTFLNWRSFTTFQKAACEIGWPIESVLIWDKNRIGTGSMKGLRNTYELVALFAMPDFCMRNRSLRDIQRFSWSGTKPHGHPAEKPVELMEWIIRECTNPKDTVADWFMGSGTVGEACINTGRRFTGTEMNEKYFVVAQQRIDEAAVAAHELAYTD